MPLFFYNKEGKERCYLILLAPKTSLACNKLFLEQRKEVYVLFYLDGINNQENILSYIKKNYKESLQFSYKINKHQSYAFQQQHRHDQTGPPMFHLL